MSEEKNMYCFSVECHYFYDVQACDEKTARKILQEKGGFEISGERIFLDDAYKEAILVEVNGESKE
tara:strand:- start:261 stop:458 length:198 start_codon:yes stop_codon:yes gene_type:complete